MLSVIMLSVIMLTVVVPQISHIQRLFTVWSQSSANLSNQDKTLAEFSTLEVFELVRAMHFHSKQKQPSLKLKTWTKQLLRSLPLAFALSELVERFCIGYFY